MKEKYCPENLRRSEKLVRDSEIKKGLNIKTEFFRLDLKKMRRFSGAKYDSFFSKREKPERNKEKDMKNTGLNGFGLKASLRIATAALSVGLLAACSTEANAPTPLPPGISDEFKADYDRFSQLNNLNNWSAFQPEEASQDQATGRKRTLSPEFGTDLNGQDVEFNCTTQPFSITQTPREIVTFAPNLGFLAPGTLLQGRGHVQGLGSIQELPIRQRAPLTVSIDILSGDNTRTIQNPTPDKVNQVIGELIEQAEREGLRAGSAVDFKQKTSHSVEQVALSLDVSARYNAFSGSASFDFDRSVDETTVTAHFVQKMFTVTITQPQTPADWFSGAFTQDVLDEQVRLDRIGPDNLPVYIDSVTYGRMMMFNFTSKGSEQEIRATLNAAFDGVKFGVEANLSTSQQQILRESEIQVVTVGGEGKNASAIIRSGNFKDYFESEAALTSAKPISFVVKNLGDNSIAKVSETTDYEVTECAATPVEAEVIGERVRVSLVDVTIDNAGDGSNGDLYGNFRLNDELAWEISRSNSRVVDSGASITFATDSASKFGNLSTTFNCLSEDAIPCSIKVTGELKDADGFLKGGDDEVGNFKLPFEVSIPFGDPIELFPFAVYPFQLGTHSVVSEPDGGGKSTLRIKIEKVCDIIEGNGNQCLARQ